MRGKRKLRITPRSAEDWDEILRVTLSQRHRDSDGYPLPGFTLAEIAIMSIEQRDALKSDGWLKLPALVTAHGPLRHEKDRLILCPCDECVRARQDWRNRTGRI